MTAVTVDMNRGYVPVNAEMIEDEEEELTPEEQAMHARINRQYNDLALKSSVIEPKQKYFLRQYPLIKGIHAYGAWNAFGFCLLLLMALIASGRTVRVWLDIIYAFGCFLPGLMNYIPLVYREYNLFWRQNVMLTAWYQVFIATLLNIGGVINILIYGNCRDDEYHDNFDECEDILVILLIIIIIIFVGQVAFMCHLA